MLPGELRPEHFKNWPPQARELAVGRIALLQKLPLPLVSLLSRELIAYDWKFPAERNELDRQFQYLSSASKPAVERLLSRFSQIRLTPELAQFDWVNAPAQFSEKLSAHLWATHQVDLFRTAAVDYVQDFNSTVPEKAPAIPRAAIVLIGKDVRENKYRLFRKLRRNGTYFSRVQAGGGLRELLHLAVRRAEAHPVPYSHWYIEGGTETAQPAGLTCLSYERLAAVRVAMAARMRAGYESRTGAEALRDALTSMSPEQVGLSGGDALWNRFVLSLFTEGSGTQIFSTTFVQWAAREVLRRAQPLTLLVRFAPRVRGQAMDQLLAPMRQAPRLDPEGSLIDADMGAWYTWINMQRLLAADKSSFLVWFEEHGEAVAVGPSFAPGAESAEPAQLADLAARAGWAV